MTKRPLTSLLSRPALIGLAVFGVALSLRLAVIPTARFTSDESAQWVQAVAIARGHDLPLLGNHVTGSPGQIPGPFVPWVLALSQLPGPSPEAAFALVALLGSLAALTLWHALRRPFGELGAFAAGLALATSPWNVFYTVSTFTVNLGALPIAVALLAAVRVREQPTTAWTATLLVASALLIQVHLSAPMIWAGLAVLAAPGFRRVTRRGLALGLAGVAILQIPLLVSEVATAGTNTKALLAGSPTASNDDGDTTDVFSTAFRLLTLDTSHRELLGDWTGLRPEDRRAALWAGTPLRPATSFALAARLVSFALAAMVVLGSAGALFDSARRRTNREGDGPRASPASGFAWAALLSVGTCAALLVATGRAVAVHYVQPLQPLLFALFAPLVARTAGRTRVARWALGVALGLVAVGGIEASLDVSRRVDAPHGLAAQRRVAEWLVEHADDVPRPIELAVEVDPGGPRAPWTIGYLLSTELGRDDIRVSAPGNTPTFVLKRPEARPPPGYVAVLDAGSARLYRRTKGAAR